MEKRRFTTRSIALMGVLMALRIVLSQFLSIQTGFVKISFFFIPVVLMAILFKPLIAGAANALCDIFGTLLFPTGGAFFPGFTLTAFLSGVVYSLFYYKKELTLKRIIVTNIITSFVISFPLNTLWLYMMQGDAVFAFIPARILSSTLLCIVQVIVTYSMVKVRIIQKQLIKFEL